MGHGVLMKNLHTVHVGGKRMGKLTGNNESSACPKMVNSCIMVPD
jgi:hypothetical protein